jgi:hypothetical protein
MIGASDGLGGLEKCCPRHAQAEVQQRKQLTPSSAVKHPEFLPKLFYLSNPRSANDLKCSWIATYKIRERRAVSGIKCA